MKNVSKPLITGYFNLLNGIIVNGETVTFHQLKAPYPTPSPYIIVTGLYVHNKNTRDGFDGEATVDLSVYTDFEGDYGNMDLADDIADAALLLIIPEPGKTGILATGFNVTMAKMIGMRDFQSTLDNKNTYGKRITIEHLIYQI